MVSYVLESLVVLSVSILIKVAPNKIVLHFPDYHSIKARKQKNMRFSCERCYHAFELWCQLFTVLMTWFYTSG